MSTLIAPAPATVAPRPAGGAYRTVGLIGPPNVGKTTLFNRLTGMRQKVSNYSGVTVEHRSGKLKSGQTVVDLPGVWSLTPESEDQKIAVNVLMGKQHNVAKLDAVLLVVDGTQLHRYMTLIGQVLACGLPTLVLINMADELTARKGFIDPLAVARELGAPTALISASRGTGMDAITRFLSGEHAAAALLPVLQAGGNAAPGCATDCNNLTKTGAYRRPNHSRFTREFDRWALHPVIGPILCLLFIMAAFQIMFRAAYPAGTALSNWLSAIGATIGAHIPNAIVSAILVDGIWNGVASVLGFLPTILCMFVVITVLEDSGYMARAAVIADRTMGRVGLNGRSFLPLLSAYACAVPAIMATRAIPSKKDRLATILIAPFMTCSARLPVYALLIAAFIPARKLLGNALGLQAITMMLLYALGLLAALFTAKLLNFSMLKGQPSLFAIELPNYRLPRLRTILLAIYDRSKVFLKQVGTVILVLNLAVWFLSHMPFHNGQPSEVGASYLAHLGDLIEPLLRPLGLTRNVGISLLTAFVARESVVSTLATLYGSVNAGVALRAEIGLAGALALLVFFALAMQCTATLAVVRRETNSWKWPLVQMGYMTVLAYAASFVTYRIALAFHV
ncbi:Fe2+ transport system protein B [Terriglobus roseus DSM 18391]|uniref:Fe2+ transport system protein B n=1 Tax=Terriglobus roseus (strain DSM 18391 / NRRL B-41598 / KBS 63) TaxID=926566 RepID=I3ZFC7_TERRK|nr:ferrous iron transporter B [Terriglobus roseus]AFL87945.1 Fe2+ transport system protein B [Terriglobus roseus DSM 18391]